MKRVPSTVVASALLFLAVAAGGCGEPPPQRPPELRLGRDECAECGMMIDDPRFAAAVVVERDGAHDHVKFDDIGCLLDFERDAANRVSKRFFRDAAGQEWIAGEPQFLAADRERLRTPMASGYAAYKDDSAAAQARATHGGEVVDLARLQALRAEWKSRRRAAPPATGEAPASSALPG